MHPCKRWAAATENEHMTTSDTPPRKTSAFNTMRAKGWSLCLLGLVLLCSPLLMGQSTVLAAYANALRPAGWFAFAAGAVLLVLHHVAQAKRAKTLTKTLNQAHANPPPPPAPETITPGGQPTLREIRDEIKKRESQSS
jgi:hypothetical protein